MLWSVLVSSQGKVGRINDDQGKDVVPKKQGNEIKATTQRGTKY